MESKKADSILQDYLDAFKNPDDPFLYYYALAKDRTVERTHYSRGEFLGLARRAAWVLKHHGCKAGDCFSLCVGANHPYDLAFRLASVMTGTVPVTINWQADTLERILYKIETTGSGLIITESHFDPDQLSSIQKQAAHIPVFPIENLDDRKELGEQQFAEGLDSESTRIIVFTSGTTGQPKGVQLPYRAYRTNRLTFDNFLDVGPQDKFGVLIVNPMHHSNSSAITDWALRRPGSHIHLIQQYSTLYWKILTAVAAGNYHRLVAPTVSRHFDFLNTLEAENRLPVELGALKAAMSKTDFLIGSAPVGPTTIRRLQHYAGRIPSVRFGATETCLQAIGIPKYLSEEAKLNAFEKGWQYRIKGEALPGYYIGRPHPPYTEARIVGSITPGQEGYIQDCETGQPGYLISRGQNVMSGYVNNPGETRAAFYEGWYTGMKDICFTLENEDDGPVFIRGRLRHPDDRLLRSALPRYGDRLPTEV
ncbi:MAG: AMP-binding protein, partial [Deltaproteobacteria bacterium]|nr:AMP-binding protein [Deltaproteobacteria bacterium]